nr:hypothetical protein [Tanacetum cinerariifolium]
MKIALEDKEEYTERLINLMKNDISDNSSNDPLLEEVDLFLFDDSIPPGIENVADDPEGDIRFLEELLINDSILSHKSFDSNFVENPSIPRPPPEPPDVESFFDLKPDELSYNQNYDGNYYSHDLPSFLCSNNCEESHETFQCQPITFQIDFFGSDQIQTPQYPDVHPPSQETKEPPQDSDMHQLIRKECYVEASEEQKQSMEDTMLELVKICREKEFLCIHDDLIESALNSKLFMINSNSQRLEKEQQEVKNVVEQPAERRNHNIQSLQNFRVIHKISISFNNTSPISPIHAIAPVLSTKEPEHLLSMGYEHLSITPKMKSNEVIESNAENLLPILSECEVTSEDEIECDVPDKDDCSPAFTTFSNPLFKDSDDLDSIDDESLPDEDVPAEDFTIYLNPLFDEDEINSDKLDPHCFNIESDFVESLLNRDTFIDSSSKFDFSGELAHVNPEIPKSDFDFEKEIRLIENLLYDNSSPRPPEELNDEIANTIVESIPSLPIPSFDSNFEENPSIPRPPPEPPNAETDAGEEIPVVMNDKDEDADYYYFMIVMFDKVFSLLSAENEDIIFDPGISD